MARVIGLVARMGRIGRTSTASGRVGVRVAVIRGEGASVAPPTVRRNRVVGVGRSSLRNDV